MSQKIYAGSSQQLWISQNFLVNTRAIDRMIRLSGLGPEDHVIEIGPGKGYITQGLLRRCGQVTAVELDAALYQRLQTRFENVPNLRLVRGDFLRFPLPRQGEYRVFANIPFSRTSEILRRLTQGPNLPADCWLVMEKGAAKRFLGLPRESLQSLLIKPFFEGRIVYHLRREDYRPQPSVETVLVHLRRKTPCDLSTQQRGVYEAFLRAQLGGKAGGRFALSRRQQHSALSIAGLEAPSPSATMRYVQWLCLFRYWARISMENMRR